MKKITYLILLSIFILFSCSTQNGSKENVDKDNHESTGTSKEKDTSDEDDNLDFITTSEQLGKMLPENLLGYPVAQPILMSVEGAQETSASGQYFDKTYKSYVKIAISEFPQTKKAYEKAWAYNQSLENETRITTTTRLDDLDIYRVQMKTNNMKFTTYYIKRRFKIYVESTNLDEFASHDDFTEEIIEDLKKL